MSVSSFVFHQNYSKRKLYLKYLQSSHLLLVSRLLYLPEEPVSNQRSRVLVFVLNYNKAKGEIVALYTMEGKQTDGHLASYNIIEISSHNAYALFSEVTNI